MTLYWWMHWFWITCKLICYISSAAAKPVTSVNVGSIDVFVPNRPLRRNIKSLGQGLHVESQTPILPVTFPTNTGITDTAINEILPQLYEINSNISLNRRIYPANTMINSTVELRNGTQFFCNHSTSDNLLLTNDETPSKKKNSTVLLTDEDIVTQSDLVDTTQNVSAHLLPTKGFIEIESDLPAPTTISSISITGITFGILMFIGLICATSIILYRRGFTNKPHTLNDKCSNLDSSGYIDDNSMRENSEEMYSLDNDSFLNSLEAMTIQNYWTDNLKHTKL